MKIEGKEAFAAKERKRSRKAKPRGDRTVYHKNYYVNNKDRFIKGEERIILNRNVLFVLCFCSKFFTNVSFFLKVKNGQFVQRGDSFPIPPS